MEPDFEKAFIAEYCGLHIDHVGDAEVELFFAGQNVCLRPALRAVYAAGLERAAEIADKSGIMFADEVSDAIRAEKEADHG